MTVAVVTDSTADLPSGLAAGRNITVVPLTVSFDGKHFLDGVEIDAAEFYRLNPTATTSQPSPARFAEAYRKLLENHEEVVSIHISERLSGTYDAAIQGAQLTESAERIRVVDSSLVSMPLGLLVLAAAHLAAEGSPGAEVERRVVGLAQQTRVYFVVATLENLRRGGRIGRASALLGSVLQVKPVLTIEEGLVTPLERVRTQERSVTRLIELVRAVDQGSGLCAIVGHAAAEEAAQRIAAEIAPMSESLLIQPLGPVVGAHAGPGTVGVGCYPAQLLPLGLKAAAAATSPR
ncbi:MAG TPA: DegV family protein [Candidatus Dormibacteraeota bacterium]